MFSPYAAKVPRMCVFTLGCQYGFVMSVYPRLSVHPRLLVYALDCLLTHIFMCILGCCLTLCSVQPWLCVHPRLCNLGGFGIILCLWTLGGFYILGCVGTLGCLHTLGCYCNLGFLCTLGYHRSWHGPD